MHYIYTHTVYIYILYIYILYIHTVPHLYIQPYDYCIYILYIHTVPHLYIQPYDGMARSVQASNDDMEFTGSICRSCTACTFFSGARDSGYSGNVYIYRTLAWNQAIDLVGWNAYMVWVIFLAIYPSGYIPFQPAHPL